MIEIKDIEKLAQLSRIDLTDEQKQTYLKEIGSILGYVDQIKNAIAKSGEEREIGDLRNVARPDAVTNDSGSNTKEIVEEFPQKEGDYLKVKKIL
ncbi:MAG: Asp-tRNA(Asn)/Glu-tRNA(Gln) amidotransferase subunit GatC [bacterium]